VLLVKRSLWESSVRLRGERVSESAERMERPRERDSIKFLELSIALPLCGINYQVSIFLPLLPPCCQVKNLIKILFDKYA